MESQLVVEGFIDVCGHGIREQYHLALLLTLNHLTPALMKESQVGRSERAGIEAHGGTNERFHLSLKVPTIVFEQEPRQVAARGER